MPRARIEVPTLDGRMTAALAHPDGGGPFPGVIVVMEAFGLNAHIEGVADRVAAAGYVALAPDLYYRESDRIAGYDELPKAISLMGTLRDERIVSDLRAAMDFLATRSDVRADAIGVMGFCLGGRVAFLAASRLPIRAAVSFYGGGLPGLLGGAAGISCPLLLLFGEEDRFIPLADVEAVRKRLEELGKAAEIVVYPGADHGFFCDERPSFEEKAAADAWRRLNEHFARHLRS